MKRTQTNLAVLDDDPNVRRAVARLLRINGYAVDLYERGDEFVKAAQSQLPDCVLLDLQMPRMTGFDVLETLSSLEIKVPVIVITGNDKPGQAGRVRSLGAVDYLLKPVSESALIEAIERACANGSPATG